MRPDQPSKGNEGPGSSAGFTLLELVISLSIMALIVVVIAGAMRLAHHSVESGEKRADYLERIRASMSLINAQVQSQVPLSFIDDGEKKFYFTGERDIMTLATNYSIWGREKGYALVTYKVETDAGGKKFIAATEHTIGIDSPRDTTLMKGFDSIYFEYYYKGPTDEKGTWVDRWAEKDSIPEKIILHLVVDKKDLSTIIPMRTLPLPKPQTAAAPGQVPATPQTGVKPK